VTLDRVRRRVKVRDLRRAIAEVVRCDVLAAGGVCVK
jgi:hypothetical protein